VLKKLTGKEVCMLQIVLQGWVVVKRHWISGADGAVIGILYFMEGGLGNASKVNCPLN
jgi:hypothetical protein